MSNPVHQKLLDQTEKYCQNLIHAELNKAKPIQKKLDKIITKTFSKTQLLERLDDSIYDLQNFLKTSSDNLNNFENACISGSRHIDNDVQVGPK